MSVLDYFMLRGKKAVVTGGARGIGNASAVALADAGADVAILDIIDADETVKQIKELGREAFAIKVDLRKEDDVNKEKIRSD